MKDREFGDRVATLAAETVRERCPHLERGAAVFPMLGDGVILFFGNDGMSPSESGHRVVAMLREYFRIDELGIRELGFGTNADHSSWALLVESRRDPEYCRRLIGKAYREATQAPTASRTGTSR